MSRAGQPFTLSGARSAQSKGATRRSFSRFCLCVALLAVPASAAETVTLPKSSFLLDVGYLHSSLNTRWDDNRRRLPLIEDVPRYEPGGGLQGILSAHPDVVYRFVVFQLAYGITDHLSAFMYLPLVLRTTIDANFSWKPGDYQPSIGRKYSHDDFWAWAQSLGQPRPPDHVETNQGTLADIVVALRYRLQPYRFLKLLGVEVAGTLAVALPTGTQPDQEQLLVAGTTTWELHAYGDVEAHLGIDRGFFTDAHGVSRLNLGLDMYYSFFRPRQYTAPVGSENPLLLTYAPYVGEKYWIDPGDWFVTTVSLDVNAFFGPTQASIVSGGDYERAQALPPMVSMTFSYSYIATMPTKWNSESALWNYDRAKFWGPGDKNAFKAQLNLSFLRVGLPFQLYVGYRAQDLAPGRNTRAANSFSAGVRLLAKFW